MLKLKKTLNEVLHTLGLGFLYIHTPKTPSFPLVLHVRPQFLKVENIQEFMYKIDYI